MFSVFPFGVFFTFLSRDFIPLYYYKFRAKLFFSFPFFPFLLRICPFLLHICPLFGAVSPNQRPPDGSYTFFIFRAYLREPLSLRPLRRLTKRRSLPHSPYFGCLPPVVSLLLAVYLRFLSFFTKKSSKICICQKIVVILHPKIYAGGICLFVRVDFLTY